MVDTVKISELAAVVTADGTSVMPVVQGGVTKKQSNTQAAQGAGSALGIGSSTLGGMVVFADEDGKQLAEKVLTDGQIVVGVSGDTPVGRTIVTPTGNFYVDSISGNDTVIQGRGTFYLPYALPSTANAVASTGNVINIFKESGGYNDGAAFDLNNGVYYNGLNSGTYPNMPVIFGGTIGLGTGWAAALNASLSVSNLYLGVMSLDLKTPAVTSATLNFYNAAHSSASIVSLDLNTIIRYDKAYIINYLELDGGTIYVNNLTTEAGGSLSLGSVSSNNNQNAYVSDSTLDTLNVVTLGVKEGNTYVRSCKIDTIVANGTNAIVYVDAASWPNTINLSNGGQVLPLPQEVADIEGGFIDTCAITASTIDTSTITNSTLGGADSTQAIARYLDSIATTLVASTTLGVSHFGKYIPVNSASAVTITLPQQSTTPTLAGVHGRIINLGAGLVTVAKEGAETLTGNTTIATNQTMDFERNTTTNWATFAGTSVVADVIPGSVNGVIVNQTYDIAVRMPYAGTITGITTKSTTTSVAGTFTVAIAGVSVTGLTTVANGASGVRTNTTASAANTFAIGDYITITFAGATITDMFWALAVTRNL